MEEEGRRASEGRGGDKGEKVRGRGAGRVGEGESGGGKGQGLCPHGSLM